MTSRGFTLLELLLVAIILATVAALALPQAEPLNPFRADAAAREVAQALRYAQSAALRTGQYVLVLCDSAANSLSLAGLDLSAKPPAADPTSPVLHPIDKKDYQIVFSTTPATASVSLSACSFSYAGPGATTATQLVFGADGAPVNVLGNRPGDVKALVTGQIVVSAGRVSRSVQVAASGRVTIAP